MLYLTYDGLTDPLGRSQILPYLTGLAARGHRITLVSCEKSERMVADSATVQDICRRARIDWHPLRFHKRPPVISSIIDAMQMKRRAAELNGQQPFDLVHCRSYMAALAGHSLRRRFGVPFLFDMRGFWADERVERGFWPKGNPLFRTAYRWFKRRESHFLRDADAVVSLTESARRELDSWPEGRRATGPVRVIPCCVDLNLFDPAGGKSRRAGRKQLALDHATPLLLSVGSLGPGYLIKPMFDLFRSFEALRPGARYLFVTHHSRKEVEALASAHGVDPAKLITVAAARDEMPALIAAGDLGVSFIMPSYAAIASSPTKVAEMLAMGVPVIANSGVGDTAEIVRESGAGAVVDRFDEHSLAAAIRKVEHAKLGVEQVRAAAKSWFALENGVERYNEIYGSIGGTSR